MLEWITGYGKIHQKARGKTVPYIICAQYDQVKGIIRAPTAAGEFFFKNTYLGQFAIIHLATKKAKILYISEQ